MYSASDVKGLIGIIAEEMVAAKEELTVIDSKLGDGDMGMSMEKGALALKRVFESDDADTAALLASGAAAFNRAAPSTMGTLLSYGIQETARFLKERPEPSEADIVSIPRLFAEIIAKRGKAKEGDKTILDALLPYARSLEDTYKKTGDLKTALSAAAEGAREGMERTKGMVAHAGRAKWLADRNKDCPDGGAVLCSRIADCLVRYHH
ncbi:MAG TPA: DAK2 domain-containing protein [Spirochaetia bacterium]|nr:DAK2 domain-containing protein [Spirochaetia bacterium]